MNPYVSFGLAMCAVLGLSLFATAYLAVAFNRRAKRDLQQALAPLAELIEGEVDLEGASVAGRFAGHIAEGQAANAPDGPGKVFFIWLIDGAGGSKWVHTISRGKAPEAEIETKFEGPSGEIGIRLQALADASLRPLLSAPGWTRIEYDPGPGYVRLTRPMQTRRDVPAADLFRRQLELVLDVADRNRAIQQPG